MNYVKTAQKGKKYRRDIRIPRYTPDTRSCLTFETKHSTVILYLPKGDSVQRYCIYMFFKTELHVALQTLNWCFLLLSFASLFIKLAYPRFRILFCLVIISSTWRKNCWIAKRWIGTRIRFDTITIWFLVDSEAARSFSRTLVYPVSPSEEMHTTRRALRRIVRSTNFRDDFNISFTMRGAIGSAPRSLISSFENGVALPSWNIADQDLRNSALSRMFARDFGTLARKEPPEPRGIPFFGTIFSLIKAGGAQKLHEYVDKRHRELGPVYREQIGPVRAVFVNSPDEFRRVLIELEGPMPQHFLPEAWMLYNEIRAQSRGLLFMYVRWSPGTLTFWKSPIELNISDEIAYEMAYICEKFVLQDVLKCTSF